MTSLLFGARVLLGVVFVCSAVGKLRGRRAYADHVAATRRLMPAWRFGSAGRSAPFAAPTGPGGASVTSPAGIPLAVRLAAAALAAEIAVPLLLAPATVLTIATAGHAGTAASPVVAWLDRAGFTVAAVLLAVFTSAILAALRRGERGPCHCFGASAHPLGCIQVLRNTSLLLAAATGVLGAAAHGGTSGAGLAVAGTAALVAALLAVRADDLADLFRPVSPGTRP